MRIILKKALLWDGRMVNNNNFSTYLQLDTLAIGERAKVVGYKAGMRGYRHKLLAMGLTPGTELAMVRTAPLGDPVELKVRGFALSLRKHEAYSLLLEKVDS